MSALKLQHTTKNIKDVFVDTPIESYIMKSLLFHKHDDESMLAPMMFPVGYAVYRFFSDNPYQVQLFSETINAKHKDMIEGFSDMQELQEYLGDNQEKYEELFNNALQYELTALKSVALGYKVDILDPIDKDYYGMPQTLQTTIKIPKEVMRNNVQVMLKIDSEYKSIYESEDIPLGEIPPTPNDFTYDTIQRKFVRNGQLVATNDINGAEAEKLAKKDVDLFIVNRDIALKYKIVFDCDYDKAEYMPKETYTANQSLTLKIDKLKLVPLETKERNMLDNIIYAKKERERELAKQQNEQAS